jgi:hypothetical protein
MAKEPSKPNGHDHHGNEPGVTDLRSYRREKEKAARKPPPRPQPPRESFLGSNPRAGIILLVAVAIIALLYLAPIFL